jgi:hypothetical protein
MRVCFHGLILGHVTRAVITPDHRHQRTVAGDELQRADRRRQAGEHVGHGVIVRNLSNSSRFMHAGSNLTGDDGRRESGGRGEIRTHVPELPDHPISSRRRYDRFGTRPRELWKIRAALEGRVF